MKHYSIWRISFLVVIAGFLCACGNGNSTPKAVAGTADFAGFEMIAIPGSTVQKAVKKDADGKIIEEGFVQNGQKNGVWTVYNSDNTLPSSIANYVNGVYSGQLIEFNKRGQIDKMTSYLNNELQGLYTKYKFGRTVESVNYTNGKMDGIYRKYFDNKDIIQQEIGYQNGELHGAYRYFNEAGDVVLEYDYKNGEKIGGGEVKQ